MAVPTVAAHAGRQHLRPDGAARPDRGMPALLHTATNGVTEAEENVNGAPAYRVHATL